MEDYHTYSAWQGVSTPRRDPTTPIQAASLSYSQETVSSHVLETPGTSQISEPPTQPPNPPKIRIKRRRAIYPPQPQSFDFGLSDDLPIPIIGVADMDTADDSLSITPTSDLRRDLLQPATSTGRDQADSPPHTPVQQIYASVEDPEDKHKDWPGQLYKQGEEIERPLSALSAFSASSATSVDSSDSGPSFGGSCTSPESESADPFVFNGPVVEAKKLSAPFSSKPSQHPSKRQKTHKQIKWTHEMDEHLWMTYMAYLSDPTVTPFKTLPGSAPPLGVCHRVAREAKRSWKGPKSSLLSIPETGLTQQNFSSLNATVMREMPAPSSVAIAQHGSLSFNKMRPVERSNSGNEASHKPGSRWPRSESSTRRRLRELCKHKPMLPPHYQRLMRTRSPSPFESSSSRGKLRSSRISPPPMGVSSESSFSTRDLHITLATSTSTTMQPDGPLSQLASEIQTPRQVGTEPSKQSSIRGAHQKSQSLQLTLGLGREAPSLRRLASPFQEIADHHTSNPANEGLHLDTGTEMDRDLTPKPQTKKLDSPLRIHAPRPMSGSMKRRAEYQLGEELIADNVDERRNFLEDMFKDPVTDGHRRVRSRGFSLGAMRQSAPPSRHLSDLFVRPMDTGESQNSAPSMLTLYTQDENGGGAEQSHARADESFDRNALAPPSVSRHARRLGSPFAPYPPSSFRNTFPRSLFPQGLESISSMDPQSGQMTGQDAEDHIAAGRFTPSETERRHKLQP